MLLSTSPMEEEKVFSVQPAGETRIKNVLTVRSWGTHGSYAVCNCLSVIDASVAQPLHPPPPQSHLSRGFPESPSCPQLDGNSLQKGG